MSETKIKTRISTFSYNAVFVCHEPGALAVKNVSQRVNADRVVPMKEDHVARMRNAYRRWETELKGAEQELAAITEALDEERWRALLVRRLEAVETAKANVLRTSDAGSVADLAAKMDFIDRATAEELKDDSSYRSMVTDLSFSKEELKSLTVTLASIKREWRRMAREWVAGIKNFFTGRNEPRTIDDEERHMNLLIEEARASVQARQEVVDTYRNVVVDRLKVLYLTQRQGLVLSKAQEAGQSLDNDFHAFTEALGDAVAALDETRMDIRRQFVAQREIVHELDTMVSAYSKRAAALMAAYRAYDVKAPTPKQGDPGFVLSLLRALSDAGVTASAAPPRVEDAVSACGLTEDDMVALGRKPADGAAPRRRMVYDVGAKGYDAGYDSDEEYRTSPFRAESYQSAIAVMADPSWRMNVLMYFGPGAGKTCAMVLALQRAAAYYVKYPPDNGVLPGVLILVQNPNALSNYLKELNQFCTGADMKGLRVKTLAEDPKKTHEWCFVDKATGKEVLLVVVHKMTVALKPRAARGWDKAVHVHPEGKKWEIPRVGAVFIDECHNMFDTSQMKTTANNHAISFVRQMEARPDIRKLLSTGTPVADGDKFNELLTLLDFLRGPHAAEGEVFAPRFDKKELLALKAMDATKRAARIEAAARAKWMDEVGENRYEWKPNMLAQFMTRLEGHISYMSLEKDPRVYPFFRPVYGGYRYNRAMVQARASKTGVIDAFTEDTNSSSMPLIVVHVPSTPLNLKNEAKCTTERQKLGKHFFRYAAGGSQIPFKWFALRTALRANIGYKHFVYMQTHQLDQVNKFAKWWSDGDATAPVRFRLPPNIKPDRVMEDAAGMVRYMQAFKRANAPNRPMYMVLEGNEEDLHRCYLAHFNSAANADGEFIRIVYGGQAVKEGVDILATNYVHLLSPPTTSTLLTQVVRRAARRCSMRQKTAEGSPVAADWFVSVIVYVADGSEFERECLKRALAKPDAPVELAYAAMRSVAVDCHLHASLTGEKCMNKEQALQHDRNNTYCINPRTGDQRLITFRLGDEQNVYFTEQMCIARECIPGALLEYDAHDEILFQLLTEARYVPVPLPPDAAPKLGYRFAENAYQSAVRTGLWTDVDRTPRLTFAREIPPEIMVRWISANDRDVGNSVLYLLTNKREAADKAMIKELAKKIAPYVERVRMDTDLEEDLKKLMQKARGADFDIAGARSASLRASEMGERIEKLATPVA
jgi:hypothetical protein